jgi:enoyl-CoA hydratase
MDLAAKAASAPPALRARVRETMTTLAGIDDHATAVDVELEAQVWSLDQPDFAERLAALQQRISTKS